MIVTQSSDQMTQMTAFQNTFLFDLHLANPSNQSISNWARSHPKDENFRSHAAKLGEFNF